MSNLDYQIEIEQIIQRSRYEEEGFLLNTRKAAEEILSFFEVEGFEKVEQPVLKIVA